ncbi:hypothetical protein BG257_10620 [Proteus mirabilis]|uniref:hypothetical protein n=1 Tax=Proteus TaxID=583 RepID=UPI0006659BED|nr:MULTISPECIES: hypothetical protein [Proteus]DAL55458.1 MAG TPA_asm: hypothetical protein [Caudoviricetes sp.]ATC75045.1 hypothetical protein BG257_10620 [Proteus mirabilis]ATC79789.1 hypothetical protein BG029_15610 [Proteus mirabilis]EHZ6744780.1 hypothetical protein [Proteus mirabilis]EKV2746718.1 hypothetical protein [Proteus mirabilis]
MQPIHKSEELLSKMASMLQSGQTIDDMSLMRYINDINKYFSGLEKNYALGIAYGLNKNIQKSIYYFELALQVPNGDYALGYLSIICNLGSTRQARELSARLATEYESKIFAKFAFQYSLFFADLKMMGVFMTQWIKLSLNEERMKLQEELKKASSALSKFRDMAGFSQPETEMLSGIIMDLIDDNNYQVLSVEYISDNRFDEPINSYMVTTNCSTASTLADMNMDLAFKFADHEEFLGKKFSVYIKGSDSDAGSEASSCQ